MRKLATLAILAFFAWLFITFTWATAAHLTGLPGPAQASAATLELAARAVTLVDPPGAIGRPQRMAAASLRRAARMAQRLHRGPERAVARVLDGLGHRHSHHRHVFARADARAPLGLESGEWDAAWQEGWSEALRELRENEALIELRRLRGVRERDCCDRALERSRERIERSRERITRSMERLQDRLDRLEASERSEVSDRLKERLRDMLRDLKRELEDLLEDELDSGALLEIREESADQVRRIAPTIAIRIHEKRH